MIMRSLPLQQDSCQNNPQEVAVRYMKQLLDNGFASVLGLVAKVAVLFKSMVNDVAKIIVGMIGGYLKFVVASLAWYRSNPGQSDQLCAGCVSPLASSGD
jgi:hypothetical protein